MNMQDEWVVCRVFQKSGGPKKIYPTTNPPRNGIMINPYALDPHSHHHNQMLHHHHHHNHSQTQMMMPLLGDPTQFLFAHRPTINTNNNSSSSSSNPYTHLFPDPGAGPTFRPSTLSGLNLNLSGHHHHGPSLTGSFSGLDHSAATTIATVVSATGYGTDMNSHNSNVSNIHNNNSGHDQNGRSSYANVDNCMDLDTYWPSY